MSQQWIYTIVYLAWLAGASCFVLGLHRMNSPATGRSGNQLSAAGMVIAVGATFIWLLTREGGLSGTAIAIIVVGFLIGGGAGLYAARTVKMTAMPQLVSLFNAVGGGAAALVAIDDFIRLNSGGAGRHDDLRRPRRAHRLGHVQRLAHRRRQAPGPHPRQADLRAGRPARHDRGWPSSRCSARVALILGAAGALTPRQQRDAGAPRRSSSWPA